MHVNAQLIKQYRSKHCWSQQQLAEMAGISMRTLQRVEKTSTASMETVKSIASVMELPALTLTQEQSAGQFSSDHLADDGSAIQLTNTARLKQKRRSLLLGIFLVCAVNAASIAFLFYQHDKSAVDDSTFYYLKNLLSITTVVSIGVALVHGYRKKLLFKDDLY